MARRAPPAYGCFTGARMPAAQCPLQMATSAEFSYSLLCQYFDKALNKNAEPALVIDPALVVLKFEETIRLRSGLRRPPDVQDNEGRIYNLNPRQPAQSWTDAAYRFAAQTNEDRLYKCSMSTAI
jgi:hypothetical protein